MKRKHLTIIITAIGLALVGLGAVQLHWLKDLKSVKTARFRQNVHEALLAVVRSLEDRETSASLIKKIREAADTISIAPTESDLAHSREILKSQTLTMDKARDKDSDSESSPTSLPKQKPSNQETVETPHGIAINDPMLNDYSINGLPVIIQRRMSNNYDIDGNRIDEVTEVEFTDNELKQRLRQFIEDTVSEGGELSVRLGSTEDHQPLVSISRSVRPNSRRTSAQNPRRELSSIATSTYLQTRNQSKTVLCLNAGDGSGNFNIALQLDGFNEVTGMKDRIVSDVMQKMESANHGLATLGLTAPTYPQVVGFQYPSTVRMTDPSKSESVATIKSMQSQRTSSLPDLHQSRDRFGGMPAPKPLSREPVISTKLAQVSEILTKAIAEMVDRKRDIGDRVNTDIVDSLLLRELSNRGVHTPYEFSILRKDSDAPVLSKPTQPKNATINSGYRATLFPNDIFPRQNSLAIYFPDESSYLSSGLSWAFASSFLFIGVVLACFAITVNALIKQKKVSDMKSDFINNMTHELKTPIATISLATEALRDNAIEVDETRKNRFLSIIQDENKRLGTQVERVLQAARLENGSIRLTMSDVDVHLALAHAVENIAMQVEQRGGSIGVEMLAETETIVADEVHIVNVLQNLLDNAQKYSQGAPDIFISTRNTSDGVAVTVTDNGIGMTRDHMKKVFDKFYRVPTGNRHDVKGFGLGLSYVKSIVDMHGGRVRVSSELGKGSTFEVIFPFTPSTSNITPGVQHEV